MIYGFLWRIYCNVIFWFCDRTGSMDDWMWLTSDDGDDYIVRRRFTPTDLFRWSRVPLCDWGGWEKETTYYASRCGYIANTIASDYDDTSDRSVCQPTDARGRWSCRVVTELDVTARAPNAILAHVRAVCGIRYYIRGVSSPVLVRVQSDPNGYRTIREAAKVKLSRWRVAVHRRPWKDTGKRVLSAWPYRDVTSAKIQISRSLRSREWYLDKCTLEFPLFYLNYDNIKRCKKRKMLEKKY